MALHHFIISTYIMIQDGWKTARKRENMQEELEVPRRHEPEHEELEGEGSEKVIVEERLEAAGGVKLTTEAINEQIAAFFGVHPVFYDMFYKD